MCGVLCLGIVGSAGWVGNELLVLGSFGLLGVLVLRLGAWSSIDGQAGITGQGGDHELVKSCRGM